MARSSLSRRTLFAAGVCGLVATAAAPEPGHAQAGPGLNPRSEDAVRKYYKLWETKDWAPFDALLADNFTFTSANNDDHISKSAFKMQCWDTQIDHIKRFDLLRVFGSGDEAFVMYVCLTKNDKTFRNVEYLRLKDEKIEAIECYFGAQSSFASAASAGRG